MGYMNDFLQMMYKAMVEGELQVAVTILGRVQHLLKYVQECFVVLTYNFNVNIESIFSFTIS